MAFEKAMEKKKKISGPTEKILRDFPTSEAALEEIFQSPWNTKPLIPDTSEAENAKTSSLEEFTPGAAESLGEVDVESSPDTANVSEEVASSDPGEESATVSVDEFADETDFERNERLATLESSIALENLELTWGGSKIINFGNTALSWFTNSYSQILGFFGIVIGFAMVPIYLYYFLKESDAIKNQWQDYVPLKASKFKTEVIETLQEINGYLISFFRGPPYRSGDGYAWNHSLHWKYYLPHSRLYHCGHSRC